MPRDAPVTAEADPAIQREFWLQIVVFNAAVLAVALGGLLLAFERRPDLGGSLLAAGVVLFAYGLYRYRSVRRNA